MGFACDKSADCKMGVSQVLPLCDESKNPIDGGKICKGNASDTGCAPDPENWCVFGIVCNSQTNICANDFGATNTRKLRLGEDTTDIKIQINRVINILLSFLAIIGVILIVYAGILWATAGGNDEQVGKARKTMIAAAIGLIIIGVAWTIISFVLNLGDTIA
ncbi:MAG: hypothetical protein UW24_C0007G0027 [Parcubacteria group bacterium GW2011_GWA2_44_12]|nr:MAG: hypothetical protein UW24_C0007G0027 [Parcubacteria group bacterium GW2011_GWA2_44_12]